jgi:hypothetical protein
MQRHIHSKDKGSLGEISVAKDLIRRGLPVFTEYGDNSKIDIITQRKGVLVTLQVKAYKIHSGGIVVRTLRSGPNYNYRYELNDFDIFAVYSVEIDKVFYIPLELVIKAGGSINLRINDLKSSRCSNVRYASDYRSLSKAIKYLRQSDNYKHSMYSLSVKKLKPPERYNSKRRFMNKDIAIEMKKLSDSGLSYKEISEKLGVDRKTVPKTINKYL